MKRLFAALCAVALLTGCGDSGGQTASPAVSLPTPEPALTDFFLGEKTDGAAQAVTMYFLSADGGALVQTIRTVYAKEGLTLAEQITAALIAAPGGGLTSAAPEGTRLLSLEQSGTHVTVNLSIDALAAETDAARLHLVCSIANTLLELDGISSVSVLIGGAALEVAGLPLGTICEPVPSVSALLAELEADQDRALSGASAAAERQVAVYRIAGDLYLPSVEAVAFGHAPGLEVLAEALATGDGAVFSSPSAVSGPSDCYVSASGMRVLRIYLSTDFIAPGITADDAVGAVILTTASFFPEIDGVQVRLNGATMTACSIGSKTLLPEGGLFRREQFAQFIGSEAPLCLADGEGKLLYAKCTMPSRAALSPRLVLEALFDGPQDGEGRSPFPAGVSACDVLGVKLEDGTATVNLSAEFYGMCQALSPLEEQVCVYAIVNTLTALEGVRGVRILIEGTAVESLAGNVSISSVLIENPGIMAE